MTMDFDRRAGLRAFAATRNACVCAPTSRVQRRLTPPLPPGAARCRSDVHLYSAASHEKSGFFLPRRMKGAASRRKGAASSAEGNLESRFEHQCTVL